MTAMQATIDHIVINVSDAEKMLYFYTRVIGLEPARVDQWRAGEVPFPSLRLCTDSLIDLFPPQMWNPKGQGDARSQAPNYDHFCLTLSREGAPDLPDLEAAMRWMAALPDERVLGDIAAAVDFLADHDSVRGRHVGITGFCMGGQYTLMAACSVPRLSAAVSWYGMLRYADTPAHKPQSPLDMAPRLGCPWLGLFGENDPLIPNDDVAELRSLLQSAGRDFEIVQYPVAGPELRSLLPDTRA